jgi:two-component system sensor histidine kinase UhpB
VVAALIQQRMTGQETRNSGGKELALSACSLGATALFWAKPTAFGGLPMDAPNALEPACRILLADDHDTYRSTMIRLLEHCHYQVTGAVSGDEALAAAVEAPFDLFVLDYKMPGNEGLVLVEQLKALQPDVPVILLTGFASLPSAMSAVRLQLFDYIQKGENPDHLLARIDEAIRHTRLEKKLRTSEDHYRLLAENIQDVVAVFSADGRAAYASPSVRSVLGYAPEAFCGTDLSALVHPDDRKALHAAVRVLTDNGWVSGYEARLRTAVGDYVWLSVSARLLRDDSGAPHEIVCSGHDITGRKQAEAALRENEALYHRLAQHLETVREEERKRLSRELHDDIGQILTALKIDLAVVRDACSCGGAAREKMDDMHRLLTEGIRSIHSLCRNLRPGALDDLGLEEALAGLVEDWRRRNAVECDLCVDVEDEALSDEIKTAAFRVLQEALTNVSRHANATHVGITLVADGETFTFSVRDNGCGMDPQAARKVASFGLLGMHERIETLGGELSIASAPGDGTRIEATIPLQPAAL